LRGGLGAGRVVVLPGDAGDRLGVVVVAGDGVGVVLVVGDGDGDGDGTTLFPITAAVTTAASAATAAAIQRGRVMASAPRVG